MQCQTFLEHCKGRPHGYTNSYILIVILCQNTVFDYFCWKMVQLLTQFQWTLEPSELKQLKTVVLGLLKNTCIAPQFNQSMRPMTFCNSHQKRIEHDKIAALCIFQRNHLAYNFFTNHICQYFIQKGGGLTSNCLSLFNLSLYG